MRSFSNILPNFATNLHLLVDSIKPQTFTPLRKKLPKNLRNKRKIHNFAPTTICTNVLLKEKKKPRSYTAKALAEQLHALL